jgi:hypothetical protein
MEGALDLAYLKSWRFSLTIVAALMVPITGYKLMFGKDVATRIAERRLAVAFPNGRPNDEIMKRQVAAARPFAGLQFSLRQLVGYLQSQNAELSWEPADHRAFVLRASGVDALTKEATELAFQFVLLDGPVVEGQLIGKFVGPAVGLEGMALDREPLNDIGIANMLADIVDDVRRQPRCGL